MEFHPARTTDSADRMTYLGPRSSRPDEAADGVDARRARSQVVGSRRRTDSRRRDPVQTVDLVLDVADDRTHDEARALALLPLADVPATNDDTKSQREPAHRRRRRPTPRGTSLPRPQAGSRDAVQYSRGLPPVPI